MSIRYEITTHCADWSCAVEAISLTAQTSRLWTATDRDLDRWTFV